MNQILFAQPENIKFTCPHCSSFLSVTINVIADAIQEHKPIVCGLCNGQIEILITKTFEVDIEEEQQIAIDNDILDLDDL